MSKWLAAISAGLFALLIAVGYGLHLERGKNAGLQTELDKRAEIISNFEAIRKANQIKVNDYSAKIATARKREANLRQELENEKNRDFLDMPLPDGLRESLCDYFGTCDGGNKNPM